MTASNIWGEHYFVSEGPEASENAVASVVAGTSEQRVAPALSQLQGEMRPDSCSVGVSLGTIQEMSATFDHPNHPRTGKELDAEIRQNYLRVEKNTHCQSGANHFLAYLEREQRSLAEVTKWDLQEWARIPMPSGRCKGNMPSERIFRGAKSLCAFAAQAGYIDAPRAKDIAESTRQHIETNELCRLLQNPMLTGEERASHIHLHYQMAEKNANRQAGAKAFLAYLKSQNKSLAEVSKSDLEKWALRPIGKGNRKKNLPNAPAFEGAKALCALAAEVGLINAPQAQELATCKRPRFALESLQMVLQNPTLTRKEREYEIRLNYQSSEKKLHYFSGADAFLAYLDAQQSSLAEVSKRALQDWALTPIDTALAKGSLPSPPAFEGAKALCALAAKVGYIDEQTAKDIAKCPRPHFDCDSLRFVLANPELTHKEREYQICLNYQSREKNLHRHSGMNGFLAYLESKGSSLAGVTKRDLEEWVLTPIPAGQGKGTFPAQRAIQGAKAVCALAAEVGYIDAQRAADIAQCTVSQPGGPSRRTVPPSEAGLHVAESSSAVLERVNKRLRTEDQGASTSTFPSFAFPQSDALLRELVLSPRSLLDPHEHARFLQTGSTLSLIDELESLEDILGSSGHL